MNKKPLPEPEWKGVFVVSATPYLENGNLDVTALSKLMTTFVSDGVQGIIVAGSTGEWYTMHDDERVELFKLARKFVPNAVTLLAGTSSIGTREAVKLTAQAKVAGCDGAMVLPPPYALPNDRELLNHFAAISEVGLPLMLYNNPGRTQITLTPSIVTRLAELESVVALKDSSKDLYAIAAMTRAVKDKLSVFSGLEPYARAAIDRGAVGIVSMCANFMGAQAVQLYQLANNGPRDQAINLEKIIDEVYEAFYLGGNSPYVIIKECMNLMGRPAGFPRLPHLQLHDDDRKKLKAILFGLGLLD
ncbi:MAG: dihydrodipicolinate synthase family protein [Gammaproteobacteria bacterium]|nr:dihydrodipicolinate synthase family protein [Gammaproteobacteria bacterium]